MADGHFDTLTRNKSVLTLRESKQAMTLPIVHLAALGGMGEFTFHVGAGAGASLELPAHLQRQPLGVAHVRPCSSPWRRERGRGAVGGHAGGRK